MEEVDGAPALRGRGADLPSAQAREPATHVAARRELGRALVAERGAGVLNVVVERRVHVLDSAQRESHEPDPVVVEGTAVARRQREHVLEELPAEERRRAGNGV